MLVDKLPLLATALITLPATLVGQPAFGTTATGTDLPNVGISDTIASPTGKIR